MHDLGLTGNWLCFAIFLSSGFRSLFLRSSPPELCTGRLTSGGYSFLASIANPRNLDVSGRFVVATSKQIQTT